jgi:2-oxoglutarate ferredoxin oxidoreductase subunit delta
MRRGLNMGYWRMPLDSDKHEIVVGRVNILEYRCKGCKYCIEFCPKDILEESKEFNEKGYYPPVVKEEGKCINCNFCETICPEFAIFVTELERRKLAPEDIIQEPALGRRRRRHDK